MERVQIVVITGLSGSGKSTAINALEDLGYFCIDNLPVALLPQFLTMIDASQHRINRMGLVIDVRGGEFLEDAEDIFRSVMAEGHHVEILFLDADDDTLVQRFSATRRKHPLANNGRISEGVAAERDAISDLRHMARHIIDTTEMNVHELRRAVRKLYNPDQERERHVHVNILSFGFRHGVPRGADLVFDVRFMRNPHFIPELRPLTGLDKGVSDYVLQDAHTQTFIDHLIPMIEFLLPQYDAEGKTYLTIAFGCTGGQHRSVTIAEFVAKHLSDHPHTINVHHRDAPR